MFQELRTSKIFGPTFAILFRRKNRVQIFFSFSRRQDFTFMATFGCVPLGSTWDQIRTGGHVKRKVRKTIFCWWIYFSCPSFFYIFRSRSARVRLRELKCVVSTNKNEGNKKQDNTCLLHTIHYENEVCGSDRDEIR